MENLYCTNCFASHADHMAAIHNEHSTESPNADWNKYTWIESDYEIEYEFHEIDLPYVMIKIAELEKLVGEHMHAYQIIDKDDCIEYTYEIEGEIRGDEIPYVARLCLGKQIANCLQKHGTCIFTAEL